MRRLIQRPVARETREAVRALWGNGAAAAAKQRELGRSDQGNRASVTGGRTMDGFVVLIKKLVRASATEVNGTPGGLRWRAIQAGKESVARERDALRQSG